METNYQTIASGCLWSSVGFLLAIGLFVVIPRIKMELRAKKILAQITNPEITSLFVAFDSVLPSQKRAIMDRKIAEMESQGWIYLKSSESNLVETIKYRGGGLSMYFVRDLAQDQ